MYASPSSVALSAGWSRSVSIAARATIGRNDTPSRLRAASTRVMSASTIVVHVAAVCSDSTIARPIDCRMREEGPAGDGLGAGSGANRGARFFGGTGSSGL